MKYGEYQLLWANGMSIPALLDLHAHELAEKQRKDADTWENREMAGGAYMAANRIDTEVEK